MLNNSFRLTLILPSSDRLFVRSQRLSLEIPTKVPEEFAARMASKRLTVVATNSGASFVYCTLFNLGIRI